MKKAFLSLSLLLLICGISMAQGRAKPPDVTTYVRPNEKLDYTFKFDKSKGFKLIYRIKLEDFKKDGKVPEWMSIIFHGPQPVNVDAFVIDGCKKEEIPAFEYRNGKHLIRDNLYNKEILIEAYIHDPPERHRRRWKHYELKIEGTYLTVEEKKNHLFSHETFGKIRGVVGISSEDAKKHTFTITLAKGHPKINEIKQQVEQAAKRHGCTVVKWEEREGYDFTWKEEKKGK